MTEQRHPYSILSDMARAGRDHAVGLPAQDEAQEYWSGIAFTLGGQRYIAHMGEVSEILRVPHFTGLPGVKSWVIGVANVRGRLVPIIDLAGYLGIEAKSLVRNRRVLVVEINDMLNGIIVDSVEGLQNIRVEDYIETNQSDVPTSLQEHVAGYYQHHRMNFNLLNMHGLVSSDSFMAVAN